MTFLIFVLKARDTLYSFSLRYVLKLFRIQANFSKKIDGADLSLRSKTKELLVQYFLGGKHLLIIEFSKRNCGWREERDGALFKLSCEDTILAIIFLISNPISNMIFSYDLLRVFGLLRKLDIHS